MVFTEVGVKPFVNVYPDVVLLIRPRMIAPSEWTCIDEWCDQQGIAVRLLNHWTDQRGECYSFRIPNTEHQTLFILRWL